MILQTECDRKLTSRKRADLICLLLISLQGYISGHSPPLWGGGIFSKLKNREEFEGGLQKRKGKGGGMKKESDKKHVKMPL